MKYPFKSKTGSAARRRLYQAFEDALERGDVPNALVFAQELKRFGIEVRVVTPEGGKPHELN